MFNLAEKIVLEIAKMVLNNEPNVKETITEKYGEFGLELVQELLNEKGL